MNEPELKNRQELIRYLLNRLALEKFPPCGLLKDLADDLGLHPTTLTGWINSGDVPRNKALHLQRRYGLRLAPAHRLSTAVSAGEQ